ncbi:MAG: LuxR C-terminal-related transcriptional regulator [Oscillospiraceae bacterium]|nr:LuxR C-terminal-related transcriptional regulator [Oscillospiraceae bacterium]
MPNNRSTASVQRDIVFLKRPQLDFLLEQAMEKPITTIIAGAGYGKTQAVISFLHDHDINHLWHTITVMDNTIVKYWENFKKIFPTQYKSFVDSLELLGFPDSLEKMNLCISHLAEATKKKCVLVYDNFHLITEDKILRFIERLINACIPNLSIILISRQEPNISIASLLSKGLLTTITERDLRFSEREILDYYNINHVALSIHILPKIYQQTHGWIFAIYLIGLSLKQGVLQEEYAVTAMRSSVFKLMECEIFSVLSNDVQHFLIQLSLFENMPQELLYALSGDNRQLVQTISSITSFIRYDSMMNTYYFHHLFLEFLYGKHELLSEQDKTVCYAKAANWYLKNGFNLDAIEYYAKGKEYLQMIMVIASYPLIVSTELSDYFIKIINKYLDSMGECRYIALITQFRFSFYSNSYDQLQSTFQVLESLLQSLPLSPNRDYLFCTLYITWGFLNLYKGNQNNFVAFFQKAYDTGNVLGSSNVGLNCYACTLKSTEPGAFEQFIADMEKSVPHIMYMTHGGGAGYDCLCKGEVSFFRRELKNAETNIYQALTKAHTAKQYYIEDTSLFYLMRMNISAGNYNGVIDIIERLKQQTEKYEQYDNYSMYVLASCWFYAAIGQMDQVSFWNNAIPMNMLEFAPMEILIAKCLLAEKKYNELLALLEGVEHDEIYELGLLGKIEAAALKAVALYHLKDSHAAIGTLQNAYMLSATNSFIMPFIELGNNMLALIKATRKQAQDIIPDDWLNNIQRKSSAYAKKISYLSAEYAKRNSSKNDPHKRLTQKELACLTDLCQGLSRAEIASYRDISQNYVKLQIQNIYDKLGARNSKEAVRIAISEKLVQI